MVPTKTELFLNLIATLLQLCGFISAIRPALKAKNQLKFRTYRMVDGGNSRGEPTKTSITDTLELLLEQLSNLWQPLVTIVFGSVLQIAALLITLVFG